MTSQNMNTYKVTPITALKENACITAKVPGSKSITNRALLLAALANGTSTLKGVLFSDDSRHFLQCIQDLGFPVKINESNQTVTVTGSDCCLPVTEGSIYVGSAGTAARFLTAMLGMSSGTFFLDASPQMRKRPMAALLSSLEEIGTKITYKEQQGCFPFFLTGHGITKYDVSVDINHSSQFLSALMISSVLSPKDFTIHIQGTHGRAYIEMTSKMMKQFGVELQTTCDGYKINANQTYRALDYQVEPDISAACYFYALAFLLGISGIVQNVHFDSLQGDVEFLHVLEQGGASLKDTPEGIQLLPPKDGFTFGEVNLNRCSDQTMTLAALAPFAKSTTTITGIGHIRYQESNRIQAIVTELSRMGISCQELPDGIRIHPGTPLGCHIQTYEDHRMAMAFSLIGCRIPDITIDNPLCCRKTFENYFDVLEQVCRDIQNHS